MNWITYKEYLLFQHTFIVLFCLFPFCFVLFIPWNQLLLSGTGKPGTLPGAIIIAMDHQTRQCNFLECIWSSFCKLPLLLSKKDSACLVIHAGFGTVSIISWFRELLGFKWILPPWEMTAVFHHIFSYHLQIISSAWQSPSQGTAP